MVLEKYSMLDERNRPEQCRSGVTESLVDRRKMYPMNVELVIKLNISTFDAPISSLHFVPAVAFAILSVIVFARLGFKQTDVGSIA